MRRPSTKAGVLPRARISASMARPPPCTTMSEVADARRTIAAAAVRTADASSRSSPPSLRTVVAIESVERRRFVEPERHVEILDGLSCGTFHQIVDAGNHYELTARTIDAPAHVAEVGVSDVLDLGEIRPREPHEGRVVVGGVERRAYGRAVDTGLQPRVDRFQNAPVERDEVRHERDRHAQLLLNFGRMPVREDAVSR